MRTATVTTFFDVSASEQVISTGSIIVHGFRANTSNPLAQTATFQDNEGGILFTLRVDGVGQKDDIDFVAPWLAENGLKVVTSGGPVRGSIMHSQDGA